MTVLTGMLLLGICSSVSFAQTSADASGEFSLQGRLTTTAGAPVADTRHTLTLTVYAKGTANAIYSEVDSVTTANGIFSTVVGDNGAGGAMLKINSSADYELGIRVDDENEMTPHIRLGRALRAAVADVAADARSMAGFTVDSLGTQAHAIVTTDASGHLNAGLLGNSLVTSLNGLHGNVNIQLTGSGVTTDTTGGTLHLNIGGGAGGSFSLPFVSNSLAVATGDVFSITNTLGGTGGAFVNLGTGLALRAQAATGSAIQASSNGALTGSATIRAENTAGAAIDAVGSTTTDAVLRVRNNAASGGGRLISALNASGNTAFEVAASGRTTITSSTDNALEVTASTAGDNAMKLNGGLLLNGPTGSGTIDLTTGSVAITNAYARANSIIMVTITSATGISTAVPLRISSQGNGTFTVSAVTSGLGSLTGNYSFNYLIINQ
ncbi:MAG: hypothetical protein JST22_18270 [Bacteroidetes bacterium]|nr:hypothetical protein [Bacteroidota bacterium]